LIQIPYSTYSVDQKSDYQAKDIKLTNKKLSFKVDNLIITTDSNYFYQINNILVALGIIDNLKINRRFLLETVKNFPETKGRREEVKNDFKFKTIVDFAHTPNALEKTLSSLKKITKGKIIVIFGATGGRDQTKRPQMGQVVSNLADIAIITSDDTRNEDISQINQQIINGIDSNKSNFVDTQKIENQKQISEILKKIDQKFTYFNIPNRQDAFNLAIKLAQPDDVVIACGKGHEDTILHGNTEYPWSETEAFRTALKLKKI
jgi:UDP-N-acetylmuramoyl-L-alanyl-D-glutamate--2,6-diaminopimelate ligase